MVTPTPHRLDEFLSVDEMARSATCAKELFAKYLKTGKEFETSWREIIQGSVGVLRVKTPVACDSDSDSDDGAVDRAEKLLLESQARKLLLPHDHSLKIATHSSKTNIPANPLPFICLLCIAGKMLKSFKKINIDFKAELMLDHDPDLVKDLMDMDMSKILRKLTTNDQIREVVPFSASIIGANMAESFEERIISVMNLIMTPQRTSLDDAHAEKLCVLRVNRLYMRKMKRAYPKLALRLSNYQTSKIRKMAAAAAKA